MSSFNFLRQNFIIRILSVFAAVFMVTAGSAVFALPNLAIEYGQSCFLCHMDPAGGGARNLYGSQFAARNELPTWGNDFDELANYNPKINNWITLGADFRMLETNYESASSSGNQIMQGAIHIAADVHPKVTLLISRDIYSGFQAAGVAHVLPMDGYLKAGKFMPNYGLRPDDHTTFIRDGIFQNPVYADVGWEVGFHPTNWEFSASLVNGTGGVVNDNRSYAVAVRSANRFKYGDLNLMAGFSFYGDDFSDGEFQQMWFGPLYGFYYNKFTFMGEVDLLENHPSSANSLNPNKPVGMVTSQMFYYTLFKGFWLKAVYDFQDYDLDYSTGSRNRYTIGAQWLPFGFLEAQWNFRLLNEDTGSATNDEFQFDAQIHLFF